MFQPDPSGRALASMAATTHWAPKASAQAGIRVKSSTAAVLTVTLSAPARSRRGGGGAGDDVENGAAPLVAGGDVEEHQLVRAGAVIGAGLLDRIAGVAQIDEVDALHHPPGLDVETGNDADLKHLAS